MVEVHKSGPGVEFLGLIKGYHANNVAYLLVWSEMSVWL